MKNIVVAQFFAVLISLALSIAPLPLSAFAKAMADRSAMIESSSVESQDTYLYLGQEVSNIGDIIARIKDLDGNEHSPLNDLHEYIKNGFLVGEYDAVLEVLEYAESVLHRSYDGAKRKVDTLDTDFESLMNQVCAGELTIIDEDYSPTSDPMPFPKHNSTTTIKHNLEVLGKTILKKHLHAKQGAHIQDELEVDGLTKFKGNVKIKGELSAGSFLVGGIAIGGCSDNLCIDNLSIVNESISGTLSVNNAVIQNGMIDNLTITATVLDSMVTNLTVISTLSANNEVVQNLTVANCMNNLCVTNLSVTNESLSGTLSVNNEVVQNLTVANCVNNLCVNNLSVTNESLSGTLSVNNEVVQNLTVANCMNNLCVNNLSVVSESISGPLSTCDVIVGCNVVMNNSVSSAVGNILKGSNRFITNFGTNNTFMGINSGNFSMSGSGNNSGFGMGALTANSTGAFNTAMGSNALTSNATGRNNTAMGSGALAANQFGTGNAALGLNALAANISGSNNIAIGSQAGGVLTSGSNNIYIGASASLSTESNVTRIANIYLTTTGSITTLPVLVDNTGQLGTLASTRKVKHNIEDMDDASSDILKLRPVTFAYNNDASETTQYGLIAEEVDELFPGIVVRDADGQPQTVQYHVLPVLLLNEIQKQYNALLMHKDLINQLEKKASLFEQQAITFAARLDALEAH